MIISPTTVEESELRHAVLPASGFRLRLAVIAFNIIPVRIRWGG